MLLFVRVDINNTMDTDKNTISGTNRSKRELGIVCYPAL
jgi:hypothetical protein